MSSRSFENAVFAVFCCTRFDRKRDDANDMEKNSYFQFTSVGRAPTRPGRTIESEACRKSHNKVHNNYLAAAPLIVDLQQQQDT
jgi:hypothetical protein